MKINIKKFYPTILSLLFIVFAPAIAYADNSSSPNYQVDQTFFGTGGELDATSSNYEARATVGELGVGLTESAAYRALAGFNTTDEPYIELFITPENTNIGYLDTGSATTFTGTFYVRAWQASGYVVRTESPPPTNQDSGHQLSPLSSGGSSTPGTEQFGINLVRNTDFCGGGCHLGTDPVQSPDGTFSFGEVEPGYDTSGTFRYNQGEIISRSNESTSVTIYTISYIYNVSTATPSGQYNFDHDLVATGTY